MTTVLADERIASRSGSGVILFGTTLASAAVLMFVLEPMVAKVVLPALGGAPAVWNTCVLFFQTMLLAGYAYAHLGPRLGIHRHAVLHTILVIVSALTLPSLAVLRESPLDTPPSWWLLTVLMKSVGLPFFVLATTAPLIQAWFARTRERGAGDPYFLYAASNVGSLAGLLLYPLVIEPLLPIADQSRYWKLGYALFAALILVCAVVLRRHSSPDDAVESSAARGSLAAAEAKPGLTRWLRWVALSFAPSSLMLAVTTFISTDVAAIPLLWVLPLTLYLLTFVLAFSRLAWVQRGAVDRALPGLILLLTLLLVFRVSAPLLVVVPIHLITFFCIALVCHGRLAEDRPTTAHLTTYYLLVAAGGVLGSLFNTFVAPSLFTNIIEYPAVLVLVCALRRIPSSAAAVPMAWRLAGPPVIAVAAAGLMIGGTRLDSLALRFGLLAFPAFMCLSLAQTRIPFAVAITGVLAASTLQPDPLGHLLFADRTFFGTYKVYEDKAGVFRALMHGTTVHGMQDISKTHLPLSYFHKDGPLGDVFRLVPAAGASEDVAVVGLGVGSIAAYRTPGQRWTFFEIDPAVEAIARNRAYFSYLQDCGEACQVVIGDARQSLARSGQQHGLIILDAFSSDAIPVHLLTREALALYLSRLRAGGVLVVHISNRHLDLEPVLANLARDAGKVAFIRRDREDGGEGTAKRSSDWIIIADHASNLGGLASDERWRPSRLRPADRLWTDDYSNILTLLIRK